jgi:hypothetical protein
MISPLRWQRCSATLHTVHGLLLIQAELLAWLKANSAGQIDFTRVYVVGYSLGGGGRYRRFLEHFNVPQVAWMGWKHPVIQAQQTINR